MSKSASPVLAPLFKRTSGGKIQIWKIRVEDNSDGSATIVREYGLVDGKKQVQKDVVTKGKNEGKRNATTPLQQALAEATSEWTEKQSRKGYGLDALGVESHAKRSVSPMLAKTYVRDIAADKIDWNLAFAQAKYDGFRCLARRTQTGVDLRTREGKSINTMPHIERQLLDLLQTDEELDGELFNPDLSLQQISSAVKRKQDLSERIQYHVYDTPCVDGPFNKRLAFVNEVLRDRPDSIFPVETVPVEDEAQLLEFHSNCVQAGYEGAILRHGDFKYESGKRSSSLVKVKTAYDAEFKIVDIKEGRGTMAGCAVYVCAVPGKPGVTFDATAPGPMSEKRRLWQEGKANIGKLLTVKYFRYTDGEEGKPYAPVALRFAE
jgi:ATP-dependent DNA ligase